VVHVFTPARAFPTVWSGFRHATAARARTAILSEPYDWRGAAGAVRLARGLADALRFRRRVGHVLAIGHLADRWFRKTGFPASAIHPFGYFTEAPAAGSVRLGEPSPGPVRLHFVGQLIPRKGVDILLRALGPLRDEKWTLELVGDGPSRASLQRLAAEMGIADRVTFLGTLPQEEAVLHLSEADLLVLPSRWDGWGAVVNEALMRGVPVVCSDRCGATDLLDGRERGESFPAGDAGALRQVLRRRISTGRRTAELTRRIVEWSERISGPAAADHLVAVLRASGPGLRPGAPWLQNESHHQGG
jgi:glycosyltransferase involved in cell wall biosynthesis